jgi:hypothetical protein
VIQARRGRPRLFDHDEIRRLYASGLSYSQVAKRVGCCPSTVQHAVRPEPWRAVQARIAERYRSRVAALRQRQANLCPCGESLDAYDNEIVLDHDHSCCGDKPPLKSCGKCDRALMHTTCNTAIGLVHESAGRLRNLAGYLESSASSLADAA